MTVTESLLQITELTKQNLQILRMLNDSFYTKSNHLSTTVGETTYVIPSYIALENKVNHLQDAFNNLVHAAKSGEAWFNFDGNSKEVLVRGYQSAPSPVKLEPKVEFGTEAKTIFKDLLTPQPFLNFDMSSLPDDITQVLVKKIIPYNSTLKTQFSGSILDSASVAMTWVEADSFLTSQDRAYIPGVDYLEYDTVYDLPIRHCTRSGAYIIEEVLTDQITENLENELTVRISRQTPLVRTEFDGSSQSGLQAGDVLTTFDGSAKLKILKCDTGSNELKLLIMSGEYVNPIAAGKDIKVPSGKTVFDAVSDYSILKLFSSVETNRELHIPLEEDTHVFIAVAPINSRLGTQSEWGEGLFVMTDRLRQEGVKVDGKDVLFRDYYNSNVKNIGDTMIEIANIAYPSITKFSGAEFDKMKIAPVLDNTEDNKNGAQMQLEVVQINKHLNDSDAVKNIRALYSQKKQYQTDLAEVQGRIASLTESLAEISFDDMSGTRSAYTAQIADLKDQQNNLTTSINKIVNAISLAANNAEIPIEGAKFRARGYLDIDKFLAAAFPANANDPNNAEFKKYRDYVLGIQVRYRYRNPDIPQANVAVIGDKFLFTEWVDYQPPLRERQMTYENGQYQIISNDTDSEGKFLDSNNVPKFNQIDIPISQGEQVEVQVRVLWGFGHPFVTTATEWSTSHTQTFPPELVQDVQVTTIIEENNNDIETNRFETILSTKGITSHVDDAIDDQDIKYFHKPESISSGFYTPERRIVPLKDKLLEMSGDITELKDMIIGTTSDALQVMCTVDGIGTTLAPDIDNVIQLPAYSAIADSSEQIPTGGAFKFMGVAYAPTNITITNTTQHTIHLFSMFPGARDLAGGISSLDDAYTVFKKDQFVVIDENSKYDAKISANVGNMADLIDTPTIRKSAPLANSNLQWTGAIAGWNSNIIKPGTAVAGNEMEWAKIVRTNHFGPAIICSADEEVNNGVASGVIKSTIYPQRPNQIITFRKNNPFNKEPLGHAKDSRTVNGKDVGDFPKGGYTHDEMSFYATGVVGQKSFGRRTDGLLGPEGDSGDVNCIGLNVFPTCPSHYGMCMSTDAVNARISLAPGESISFALHIEYRLNSGDNNTSRSYTIGFNVRNSLYTDPLYYQIKFVAKYQQSTNDKMLAAKTNISSLSKYNVTVR